MAAARRGAMWLPSTTPLRGLLRCLDADFFIPSFEEEGFVCIGDLRHVGAAAISEFMVSLAMPHASDRALLEFAFGSMDGEDKEQAEADKEEAQHKEQGRVAPQVVRCGRAFDDAWLEVVAPLYSLHMGCENMGPLLYSLVRFVKPTSCLEIGAGYTSAFLLQALEDNAAETDLWARWAMDAPKPHGESSQGLESSWLVPQALPRAADAFLHCVDNLAHSGSTAWHLLNVAHRLGLERRLQLHIDNAGSFLDELAPDLAPFDFVWLDGLLDFAPPVRRHAAEGYSVGAGIDAFLEKVWPLVAPGGLVLLHSTLTNSSVRKWLEGIDGAPWGPPGAVLSLLEPHKRFQNSVTLLQRRPPGYGEPIYSKLP